MDHRVYLKMNVRGPWPPAVLAEIAAASMLDLSGRCRARAARAILAEAILASRVREVCFEREGCDTDFALPASATSVRLRDVDACAPRCLLGATKLSFDNVVPAVVHAAVEAAGPHLLELCFVESKSEDLLRRVFTNAPRLERLSVRIDSSAAALGLAGALSVLPETSRPMVIVRVSFRDGWRAPESLDLTPIVEASAGLGELVVDAGTLDRSVRLTCREPSAEILARFERGLPKLRFSGVDPIGVDPGLRRLFPHAVVQIHMRNLANWNATLRGFRADPALYREVADSMIRAANECAPRELVATVHRFGDEDLNPIVFAFLGPMRAPLRIKFGPTPNFPIHFLGQWPARARDLHTRRAIFAFISADGGAVGRINARDGDGALLTRVVGCVLGGDYRVVRTD